MESCYVSLTDDLLLSKLLADEVLSLLEGSVKEPRDDTQCEHVLAPQSASSVHIHILEYLLNHRADGTCEDSVGVEPQLLDGIVRLVESLLEILLSTRVAIDNNDRATT